MDSNVAGFQVLERVGRMMAPVVDVPILLHIAVYNLAPRSG